jgi:type II secretory pathway component PulK
MKLLRGKNSEKGVAMLMALVTLFILSILAGEIVYQSSVFTSVVFRQRDALRATLLARSGLRLALLQLKATKKAKAKAKSLGMGDNMALIDKIWQTPMILPPPDLPGLNTFDTSALAEFRKSLGFEGVVNVTIIGENGRMSLNSMVWPISSAAARWR